MSDENLHVTTAGAKRTVMSGSKILINFIISLVITLVLILSSFFLFGGVALKLADKTFWIQKLIMALATFCLMIAISNIAEELAAKKDKSLTERLTALDTHYQTLMQNYETDKIEIFLSNINKANKYQAYISRLKRKLKHARRADTIAKINEKLTVSAEELWSSAERVKYYKITYNQLISGAFDVSVNDSEYDLNVHKARYGLQKFGWKMAMVIAVGGVVGDLLYSYIDFTRDMIIPLIFKIFTILMAVYSGVCFGFFVIERTKAVTKSKLRIFSQFRSRINDTTLTDDTRFLVEINPDILVEKVKAQLAAAPTMEPKNAIKQTFDETFGSGIPVKAGGFLSKTLKHIIDNKNT